MATWDKIDDVNRNIREEPWSLYWAEMKSGSDEFEAYLKDPIKTLSNDITEVEDDWKVITNIVNHHKGFMYQAVCNVAMADPESKTVFLTIFKH